MVLSKPGARVRKTVPSGSAPQRPSGSLQCAGSALSRTGLSDGASLEAEKIPSGRPRGTLSACAVFEGWVELPGSVLLSPESAEREQTAFVGVGPQGLPSGGNSSLFQAFSTLSLGEKDYSSEDAGPVWASICSICLFFAASPLEEIGSAPYVLTDARNIKVANVCSKTNTITLQGLPNSGRVGEGNGKTASAPIKFVVLLSDGRWREVVLESLDMKVKSAEDLHGWVSNLV